MGVGPPGELYLCAVWLHGGTLESPEPPDLEVHFLPVVQRDTTADQSAFISPRWELSYLGQ